MTSSSGPSSAPPSAALRLALLAIAIVSGIAFAALALVVAGGPLAIDTSVADWLHPLRLGVSGVVVDAVNLLGQALVWDPLVLLLAIVLWWRGLRFEAALLVVGLIGAEAGASVAKIIVGRGRPPGIAVTDLITQASYPSGHVTRAVVTGGLLASIAWRRRAWFTGALIATIAYDVLIGAARIAVGEHWFTDVIGAWLYGLFALAVIGLVAMWLRPVFERRFGFGAGTIRA